MSPENVDTSSPSPCRGLFLDPARYTPGLDIPLVNHLRSLGSLIDFGICTTFREVHEPLAPDFEFFRLTNRLPQWLIRQRTIRRLLRGLEYPLDLWRLRGYIRRRDHQVVHFTWMPVPALDLLLMRSLSRDGRALILTACNAKYHESDGFAAHWKQACQRVDRIICLSEHVRDTLVHGAGVDPAKVTVIPRGDQGGYAPPATDLAAQPFPEAFRGHPVAVCLGNIRPYKGVAELLAAWPKVLARMPEARLVVAGQLHPDCEQEVRSAERELGAARDTVFLRYDYLSMADYYGYLSAATALVQPYRSASQSGNTVQAYRFGVPVICTRVGGLPEMVVDGVTGAIVEPDDLDALAGGIARVLRQNIGGQMAESCRAEAEEKYEWLSIARATLNVYRIAMMARSEPRPPFGDIRPHVEPIEERVTDDTRASSPAASEMSHV